MIEPQRAEMMVMVGSQAVDRCEEEEAGAKITLGLRHRVKPFCLYPRKSGKLVLILGRDITGLDVSKMIHTFLTYLDFILYILKYFVDFFLYSLLFLTTHFKVQ